MKVEIQYLSHEFRAKQDETERVKFGQHLKNLQPFHKVRPKFEVYGFKGLILWILFQYFCIWSLYLAQKVNNFVIKKNNCGKISSSPYFVEYIYKLPRQRFLVKTSTFLRETVHWKLLIHQLLSQMGRNVSLKGYSRNWFRYYQNKCEKHTFSLQRLYRASKLAILSAWTFVSRQCCLVRYALKDVFRET